MSTGGEGEGVDGFFVCSPTAESFGVSAQIGSGVVWGGPEVRFHEGSTRVPRGSARATGWYEHKKEHSMLLGYHLSLLQHNIWRGFVFGLSQENPAFGRNGNPALVSRE